MKFLIDMNLSPAWCDVLREYGWEATHWTELGESSATDQQIMSRARTDGWIVFTHDMDFGTILALTKGNGPSVIQVRTRNVNPLHLEPLMVAAIRQFEEELTSGAIVVISEAKARARILPIR